MGVAGVLVGLPLSFLAGLLAAGESLEGVTMEPAPVVIPVSVSEFTDEREVQIALSWKKGGALRAPPWSGLVTQLYGGLGGALSTGDKVVAVDGITRLAVSTGQPFHRRLGEGDRGPDVAELNLLLVRLGHLEAIPTDASIFDASTRAAVEELASALGVAGRARVFDPGWVIWMPREPFQFSVINARVGSVAPGPGEVLVAGAPRLVTARVKGENGGGSVILDASVIFELQVGNVTARIRRGYPSVASRDLAKLAGALRPLANEASGRLLRATPLEALAVPTPAVMSAEDGSLCVWVPDQTEFSAMAVEAVDAQGSLTRLLPGSQAPSEVLANPAEVLEDPTCPSG